MPKCLGVYIEDDIIKYAKVDKTKDILRIESSGIVFYERENIVQTIEKIVRETFSAKEEISINISNEMYNYFDVFSALKKTDRDRSVELDFELICNDQNYNKDSLEARWTFQNNPDDEDKLRAIHIATNKENIHRRIQNFTNVKVSSATPISTSIFNLLVPDNNENALIVNIEDTTRITTIKNGSLYEISTLTEGMGNILEKINRTENSMQKSYECCQNTTIYTQDMQGLQIDENDHLDDIMPTLYNIVSEVNRIVEMSFGQISKIYVTGLVTAINNIDLYFQEQIPSVKCELLKPFFLESVPVKIPIKDYIEVNSATALALDRLGYGFPELNFRGKNSRGNTKIDAKSVEGFLTGLIDPNKELTAIDKTLLRLVVCLCIGIVAYAIFSGRIINKIDDKKKEVAVADKKVSSYIDTIKSQKSQIDTGSASYKQMVDALTAISEDTNSNGNYNSLEPEIVIEKNAIPNLLNRLVNVIPRQVKVTSIRNSQSNHIVIEAQAAKYEQLGYFRAAIATEGILDNVKSTSGTKSGGIITITIEGDLP